MATPPGRRRPSPTIGDRLVGGHRGGRGDDLGLGAEQFVPDVRGQHARVRIVEHQRGRQPQPGRGGEAVAQVDGGERVEPELLEGPARVDGVRRGVAEHLGDLTPDQIEHQGVAVGGREPGQPVGDGLRRGPGPHPVAQFGQVGEGGRDRGPGTGVGRGGPVDVGDRDERLVERERLAEQGERLGRVERPAAAPLHLLLDDVGPGHAVSGPVAPAHRQGGQAERTAVVGESVEVGVAGGVVALPGHAVRPGEGGEQRRRTPGRW